MENVRILEEMDVRHGGTVRMLYKTILRLHRGLPEDLGKLGTNYVRDEFKRHLTCDPPTAVKFVLEWTEYAKALSQQLSIRGIKKGVRLGSNLNEESLGDFREDQVVQLYELMKASTGLYEQPK